MKNNPSFLLHTLVNNIVKTLLPAAVRKNSFIINDIPGSFLVDADEQIVASLINNLLEDGIASGHDDCIRIGSNLYGNHVILYIKQSNKNSFNQIQRFQPQIDLVGGHIGITYEKNNIATLTFSFPQQLAAA